MKKIVICLLSLAFTGCGVAHIKDYEPKKRKYQPKAPSSKAPPAKETGSVWSNRSAGNHLFTDVRAFGTNDLVMVNIVEVASANREADTEVGRSGSFNFGGDLGEFLRERSMWKGLNPDKLFYMKSNSQNRTNGSTSRSDNVRFTVAATVTQVLPNGNLFVEGHRVVLVNSEEHHFYISGVARPQDIGMNNTISSTRLADAHVEFVGQGVITEGQDPGWFTRLLNFISPF